MIVKNCFFERDRIYEANAKRLFISFQKKPSRFLAFFNQITPFFNNFHFP